MRPLANLTTLNSSTCQSADEIIRRPCSARVSYCKHSDHTDILLLILLVLLLLLAGTLFPPPLITAFVIHTYQLPV